jgi:hypothetical protein
MTARLLAAAAICTAAPLFAMSPTAHAASATVVGEASCLYAGPSWMSSWSVTSAHPYSVYGAGLERTHQFDESSATLEVLVNVGSATEPRLELVSTTITRPEGCDGTTPAPAPIPAPDPEVEVEPVGAREPIAASATVVGEASCLYGGPSWMSSWSVTSSYPFSVYGAGLQRTHQFDEDSAMLEVLVNVGSATAPQFELVSTTIARPDGCDGITPPVELVVDAEPIVVDPVVESEPPAEQADALPEPEVELADDSAPVAGPESLRASDDDDDADRRDDRRSGRWHRALHHRSANLDDDDRRDRRSSFDREDRDDRKDRSAFRLRHRLDLRD